MATPMESERNVYCQRFSMPCPFVRVCVSILRDRCLKLSDTTSVCELVCVPRCDDESDEARAPRMLVRIAFTRCVYVRVCVVYVRV